MSHGTPELLGYFGYGQSSSASVLRSGLLPANNDPCALMQALEGLLQFEKGKQQDKFLEGYFFFLRIQTFLFLWI